MTHVCSVVPQLHGPGYDASQEGAPGDSEERQQGLLSILPPQQAPTQLETETTPPMYPLDDFEAQEPEVRTLK